jgi:hypothetical protein
MAQVRAIALGRDGLLLRADRLRTRALAHVARLGISTSSVDQEVGHLSGGNLPPMMPYTPWLLVTCVAVASSFHKSLQ